MRERRSSKSAQRYRSWKCSLSTKWYNSISK